MAKVPPELIKEAREFIQLMSASVGAEPPDISDEQLAKEIADWLPEGAASDPTDPTESAKPAEAEPKSTIADEPDAVKPTGEKT